MGFWEGRNRGIKVVFYLYEPPDLMRLCETSFFNSSSVPGNKIMKYGVEQTPQPIAGERTGMGDHFPAVDFRVDFRMLIYRLSTLQAMLSPYRGVLWKLAQGAINWFTRIESKILIAPQAHFDPVWGLAKWCVRRPFVTVACVSRDFVCETAPTTFSEN